MRTAPIAALADVTLGKMLQKSQRGPGDESKPYLRAAHVQPNGVLDLDVEPHLMWFSGSESQELDLRRGDVVVVEGGVGGYGRAAWIGQDLHGWGFQNSIVRLRPRGETDGRYLAHALVAARNNGRIAAECSGAGMPHFTAEKVSRFRVPHHPGAQQRRIADYLDRETVEIDAMDAELNRLIQTLEERRTEQIRRATAGSCDWPVSAMQYVCSIETGERDTVDAVEGGDIPFYVRSPKIEAIDAPTHSGEAILTPGDGAGVGKIYHHHRGGDFAAHQRVYVMRDFHPDVHPRFFYWHFSGSFGGLTEMGTAQSTVPSLRRPMLASFPIPLPPLEDQQRIASTLDEQTARIDEMIADANHLKALLAERRSTLITEIVTGRKKVPA